MSISDLLWLLALIITHSIAYCMGLNDKPEPFKPTNEAWVAVQCHAIDKQFEHERWMKEHDAETEQTAPSGD